MNIMKKCGVIIGKIISVFIAFAIFLSIIALGDIAPPNSLGPTMEPLNTTAVQIVNETVHINMDKENATVECNFTLKNLGEKEDLLVGFPDGLGWNATSFYWPLNDFKAIVDSQIMETKTINISGKQWKVWNMSFEKMEIKNVRVSYWVPVSSYGYAPYHKIRSYWFTYILTTGAAWKGVIEEANITIVLHNIEKSWIIEINPHGYVFDDNKILWHFKSIEPTEDIHIKFETSNPVYEQAHTISGFILDRNQTGIPDAIVEAHYWYPNNNTTGEIVNDINGNPLITKSSNGTYDKLGFYNLTNLSYEWLNMVIVARVIDATGKEIIGASESFSYDGWFGEIILNNTRYYLPTIMINVTVNVSSYIKGDFNNNGRVDIGDVAYVAYMVIGKIPPDLSADLNGNERVDIGDAAKIAFYVAGKIKEL